jgi:hypothetical protein
VAASYSSGRAGGTWTTRVHRRGTQGARGRRRCTGGARGRALAPASAKALKEVDDDSDVIVTLA